MYETRYTKIKALFERKVPRRAYPPERTSKTRREFFAYFQIRFPRVARGSAGEIAEIGAIRKIPGTATTIPANPRASAPSIPEKGTTAQAQAIVTATQRTMDLREPVSSSAMKDSGRNYRFGPGSRIICLF